MRTLLLVDDDQHLLANEARTFARLPSQFRLLTADNGHDALAILETRMIDLLVTDLQMPMMDGFELLSRALVVQPDLALLLLSELDSDSLEGALESPGTTEVLLKPIAPGLLLERARAIFAHRTRGHLSGISLSGFLQLLHLEGRSCALTVRTDSRTGTIELFDGELTTASTGTTRGIQAIFEILSWPQPDLEIVGTFASGHRDIDRSLEGVLLDAARTRDEAKHDQALKSQWIESKDISSSSLPPIDFSAKQLDTVQLLLHRLILLEGALGATLIDTRSGVCLATESQKLKAEFEETAAQFATVVRTRRDLLSDAANDRVERVVLRRSNELEVFSVLPASPLAVYFLARSSKTHELESLGTIDRIVRKIQEAVSPKVAPLPNENSSATVESQTLDEQSGAAEEGDEIEFYVKVPTAQK